jgi:class 3 adenylate cyclase
MLSDSESNLAVLGRLLFEDVCSDLVRYLHSEGDPARLARIHIDNEYPIGDGEAFADIRVEPLDERPYFVEVKYGQDPDTIVRKLARKYNTPAAQACQPAKLVVVLASVDEAVPPDLEKRIQAIVPPGTAVEIWGPARLRDLIAECFGVRVESFAPDALVDLRARIDEGKERLVFGDAEPPTYADRVLRQNLLWHFSTWRLRQLRAASGSSAVDLLVPPGEYDGVIVMMADLSGFSKYVRDTPDEAVVRQALTSFYAKARHQVINAGGFLDKFVGDEVVALFGLPDRRPGYVEDAARTAIRLLDIARSVAHGWQSRIDLVQASAGAHVGMAMGRVQLLTLRALDFARLGMIGDCMNLAARLLPLAGPGEIVVSNVLQQAMRRLDFEFTERPSVDAKNLGSVRAWQLHAPRIADCGSSTAD